MRQAVILAGGKGTRLKNRLNGLPKPLIDLCGVPLLERQILLCKRYDVSRILILVNYAAERIEAFCNQNNNWGIDIRCLDDGEPRGTAGAVIAACPYLEEQFLVIYGDTMLDVDLERFFNFHNKSATEATLFLHPNDHPHDSDIVDVDEDGAIQAFYPYPHPVEAFYPNLVNAALYIIQKSAIVPWLSNTEELDFGKHLFPRMLAAGQSLRGYNSPEYIKDCGTPERLDRVSADFQSGRIARSCLNHSQKAIFLDRDGTINDDIGHLSRIENFRLIDNVATAIRRINRADYRSVVVTNQPVIARGECSRDNLRKIHNKMETLLGREGAYLDRIYYCPHHPDQGFAGEVKELKIVCGCRKPEIGMIQNACKDLNINLAQSWMVGDSTADILAARSAGLTSVLVETGAAGCDGKYTVTPDFVFSDLAAAVTFILDDYSLLASWASDWCHRIADGTVVFIGGLSRSGKTTVAQVMRRVLRQQGRGAVVLSLDRWLLSEVDRLPGVMGRYDGEAIQATIKPLVARQEAMRCRLPYYDKWHRKNCSDSEQIHIDPADVVLIEGTIALGVIHGLTDAVLTLHVEVDEGLRRALFMREYIDVRGYSERDAEALYQSRLLDESPVIQEFRAVAKDRLKLPFSRGA
jgi:D,D-heptose 1,7-bisphosphate phosphatase